VTGRNSFNAGRRGVSTACLRFALKYVWELSSLKTRFWRARRAHDDMHEAQQAGGMVQLKLGGEIASG
jgi:hypothetical protein